MFYNRRWWGRSVGLALLFIGLGMLLATLLAWGWFMCFVAVLLIGIGAYLSCC